MEKIVDELKKVIEFKDTTAPGDIVLVAAQDPQMLAYALVTEMVRDDSKRDEWWFVSLKFLTVPLQDTTWILRAEQMTGMEIFTMDGAPRFMKAIAAGVSKEPLPEPPKRKRPKLRVLK